LRFWAENSKTPSGFNKHYRLRSYAVNTKLAKDILFARLRVIVEGPRYLHFPKGQGYSEEFFQQLCAEVLKTRYTHGFPEQFYEKVRDRNEALDRRVYLLAGLDILKPNLTAIARRLREGLPEAKEYQLKPAADDKKAPEGDTNTTVAVAPAAPVPKALRPRRPGRGGFVQGWKK